MEERLMAIEFRVNKLEKKQDEHAAKIALLDKNLSSDIKVILTELKNISNSLNTMTTNFKEAINRSNASTTKEISTLKEKVSVLENEQDKVKEKLSEETVGRRSKAFDKIEAQIALAIVSAIVAFVIGRIIP